MSRLQLKIAFAGCGGNYTALPQRLISSRRIVIKALAASSWQLLWRKRPKAAWISVLLARSTR
jgi:hypothetical protein